jgi:predicted NBD/HSP70 family sugar kinase
MMKASKATRGQLRSHNRQLLLRAVYSGLADNRAALAQETGLAKPTVSDLISELIDEGLLVEGGHGQSTDSGGKRPRLLEFVPDARQVIGISLSADLVSGVLANLGGQVYAEHYADLNGAQGQQAIAILQETINGLVAQLDAPLLCVGIGVAGAVENAAGVVQHAPYLGWRDLPLASILSRDHGVPVYVANSTELAAMGQYMFGTAESVQSLVTIVINDQVGIGLALNGAVYHSGSDIGSLQVSRPGPAGGESRHGGNLETRLGWCHVRRRAAALRREFPGSMLPADGLTYLHIRRAAASGDPAASILQEELAGDLALIFAWAIALLRPDHVSLAGSIADLGESLLSQTIAKLDQLLVLDVTGEMTFSLANSSNLVALGAVAHTLQKELGLV